VHEPCLRGACGAGKAREQGLLAEIEEDRVAVRERKERVQTIGSSRNGPRSEPQCIDVVVSEDGSTAGIPPQPERFDRSRAPVHEVSRAPERVPSRLEANRREKALGGDRASVDVADDPVHRDASYTASCGPPRGPVGSPRGTRTTMSVTG